MHAASRAFDERVDERRIDLTGRLARPLAEHGAALVRVAVDRDRRDRRRVFAPAHRVAQRARRRVMTPTPRARIASRTGSPLRAIAIGAELERQPSMSPSVPRDERRPLGRCRRPRHAISAGRQRAHRAAQRSGRHRRRRSRTAEIEDGAVAARDGSSGSGRRSGSLRLQRSARSTTLSSALPSRCLDTAVPAGRGDANESPAQCPARRSALRWTVERRLTRRGRRGPRTPVQRDDLEAAQCVDELRDARAGRARARGARDACLRRTSHQR